ncbi:MAG: transcriptional regulator with XRE-family HTH domain [Oceanicoccus sp.]|jgi:transcriptional regulator with XRE-family HTH domain
MPNQQDEPPPSLAIGRFVKFWREVHHLSQEELAFTINSSQRHISRIEGGNTRPSEAIVTAIAKALELGHRDSNHLLIAAGFVPAEHPMDFHSPDLKWLRKAMTMTLRALDPYPTALLDSSSNILMVNRGWVGFYRHSINPESLNQVSNYYDFMFSRKGAGNIMSNWEDTLSVILMSLTQRGLFSDNKADKLLPINLAEHPSVPDDWQQRAAKLEPMASFRVQMQIDETLHRFFNVNSTVGALGPTAYGSEPSLTIQTLYPEDESFDLSAFLTDDLKHPLLFY